jgi:hypothetical protein
MNQIAEFLPTLLELDFEHDLPKLLDPVLTSPVRSDPIE